MSTSKHRNHRRARSRSLVLGIVALFAGLALAATGCGKNGGDPAAGEGEECTTSKDCQSSLLCRQQGEKKVCVKKGDLDVGVDGGESDTGVTDTDTSSNPTEEDYYISYVIEPGRNAKGRLHVYNTADATDVTVSPKSINCSFNCWLSRDMKHFVYAKKSGGSAFDVYVADVGSDLKAKGTGSPLVKNVEDITVDGTHVTYKKAGQSASDIAYFKPISGGKEKSVGSVDSLGDWFVDADNDIGVTYTIGSSAQRMEMKLGKAASRKSDASYTFGGSNFQEESGSYFGGEVLTETSPDGKLMAIVTSGAPNNYQFCRRKSGNDPWSSEECDKNTAMKCGRKGRCTRLEVTVHIIDTSKRDNLGTKCTYGKKGACGPIHQCDAPSAKQSNQARCIPKRVVLGVPRTKQGPNTETTGCELIEKDDDIDFTSVHGPISFDEENNIYLVGLRDRSCIASQIVRQEDHADPSDKDRVGTSSKVIRIDPREGSYEKLAGLPDDKLFKALRCYNKKEQKLEIRDECRVWIDRARVSPGGDEIAYTATNPNTSSWPKSDSFIYLWHMLSDGSERWFTGDLKTNTLHTTTEYLRVHPPKK